ncbi:MAG TPA: hypothetical protein VFU99_00880 [Gaiellaceae bacterium]|nr:hypothetical protein [Gaiellaceae bacterium]
MDTIWWVVIAAVAIVLVAIAAQAYARSRRRSGLREQFGPEYDRTVGATGSERKAERELAERERQYASLDIRPLSEDARARFSGDWQRAESHFVDDPELAAREADRVVRDVLDARGYPSDDFDRQAAAVSVDHPHVVDRYRHGHEMVHGDGASGDERTENLRQAMVDFRAVFHELVEEVEREPEPEPELAERS